MNRTNFTSKAFRETSFRTLKKLTVVLLGVVAFFSLRMLENAKTDYDKERAIPIVIVEGDPKAAANPEPVVKLGSKPLKEKLKDLVRRSEALAIQQQEEVADQSSPGGIALRTLSDMIKESIDTARRSPFDSQEKFVEYLNGRINSAKDAADKQLIDIRAKTIKSFEELGDKYSNQPAEFEAKLKEESDQEFETKFETAKDAKKQSLAPTELSSKNYVALAKKVEQDRALADHKLVSDAAYYNIDALHSDFVPFLTQYVASQKKMSPHPSSLSEMVLDERRGGHVIYQVFYLAFICVLVFGILFPIYLLLSLFPAFSSGMEPLKDQAKGLLTRRGAAGVAVPALLKTVALSAAAVGIGAAVVIANNPVTSPKFAGDSEIAQRRNDSAGYPPRQSPSDRAGQPGRGSNPLPGGPSPEGPSPGDPEGGTLPSGPVPTDTHSSAADNTSERPIQLYPTFYPTFTMDNSRARQLENEYRLATTRLNELEMRKLDTQTFSDRTAAFVTNKQLNEQVADLPSIRGDVSNLKNSVANLKDLPNSIAELKKTHADLSTKLDANTSAITGYREGTQGRSIMSRARELFGRERYQVTPASYEIVSNLLCKQTDCTRSGEQVLLSNLRTLAAEQKSMDKKTFQKRLGLAHGRLIPSSQWEALILRYNRVPY
jgi:hypothetical protein